jgi:hypothetical protein
MRSKRYVRGWFYAFYAFCALGVLCSFKLRSLDEKNMKIHPAAWYFLSGRDFPDMMKQSWYNPNDQKNESAFFFFSQTARR